MFKDINFNETEPNSDNIDFVFSKILFCLTSAFMYNEYSDMKEDIKYELDNFTKLLKIYTNSKNLLDINFDELDNIAIKISTMDCKTVTRDGLYLEMADIWLSILIGFYDLLKKETNYGK